MSRYNDTPCIHCGRPEGLHNNEDRCLLLRPDAINELLTTSYTLSKPATATMTADTKPTGPEAQKEAK